MQLNIFILLFLLSLYLNKLDDKIGRKIGAKKKINYDNKLRLGKFIIYIYIELLYNLYVFFGIFEEIYISGTKSGFIILLWLTGEFYNGFYRGSIFIGVLVFLFIPFFGE